MAPYTTRTVSGHYYEGSERFAQDTNEQAQTKLAKLNAPTPRSKRDAAAQRRRLSSKVRTLQFAAPGCILALTDCAGGTYHAEDMGVGRFLCGQPAAGRVEITWANGEVTETSWPSTGFFVGSPLVATGDVLSAPSPSRKRSSLGAMTVKTTCRSESDTPWLTIKSTLIRL